MGLLNSIFGKDNESLEERLLREYTSSFRASGASETEARQTATNLMDRAKQMVRGRGWTDQLPKRGDALFEAMDSNPQVREVIETLRKEGVLDEDIRNWNNLPPLERAAIYQADDLNRGAAFIGLLRQGRSPDEAAAVMLKGHAKFGSPASEVGEDRPLPIELKFQIVQYVENQLQDPTAYKNRLDKFSSFNALIRHEIRNGNL